MRRGTPRHAEAQKISRLGWLLEHCPAKHAPGLDPGVQPVRRGKCDTLKDNWSEFRIYQNGIRSRLVAGRPRCRIGTRRSGRSPTAFARHADALDRIHHGLGRGFAQVLGLLGHRLHLRLDELRLQLDEVLDVFDLNELL